jgi:hypothetical protein
MYKRGKSHNQAPLAILNYNHNYKGHEFHRWIGRSCKYINKPARNDALSDMTLPWNGKAIATSK